MSLLEQNNVKSIAGNAEEYITRGCKPFPYLFERVGALENNLWTMSKLSEHQKGLISLYPHSIELLVGGKRLALCYFSNDIRFDFTKNSTWSYQQKIEKNISGYEQFFYTNSSKQLELLEDIIKKYGKDSSMVEVVYLL